MINRISIVGGPGTGKTTLGNMLSEILEIPVLHIDGVFYEPNWVERDKDERDRKILEFANKEKWIIDGTYRSTLKERLKKSDLIIYLDYSTIAQVKGVLGRFIKNHGKEKPEIPGCKERMSFKFFMLVVKWRKDKRKFIVDTLNFDNPYVDTIIDHQKYYISVSSKEESLNHLRKIKEEGLDLDIEASSPYVSSL